jgi:hypothetical protein
LIVYTPTTPLYSLYTLYSHYAPIHSIHSLHSLCANAEGIAKAAANGARSLLWWAVKQEEKKGKWDLMPDAPASAGKAAASSAAYVGAFLQQAALAAGTAAGDMKIALHGPPTVGPPDPPTFHTPLQAGTEAAAATVLANGFARDAVWSAGLAAGTVQHTLHTTYTILII